MQYISNKWAGDADIIIKKLGIQAEPGVEAYINGSRIIIGRSGIYELDNDNIVVENLYLKPKTLYKKDEEKTNIARENAVNTFNNLKLDPYAYDHDDNSSTPGIAEWDTDTMDTWVNNYKNTINPAFEYGYTQYLIGKFGSYSDNGTEDFYNLIIDFVADLASNA